MIDLRIRFDRFIDRWIENYAEGVRFVNYLRSTTRK